MGVTHGDYIKSCVVAGKLTVSWVSSSDNEADIMIKLLPEKSFLYLRDKILNLREIQSYQKASKKRKVQKASEKRKVQSLFFVPDYNDHNEHNEAEAEIDEDP